MFQFNCSFVTDNNVALYICLTAHTLHWLGSINTTVTVRTTRVFKIKSFKVFLIHLQYSEYRLLPYRQEVVTLYNEDVLCFLWDRSLNLIYASINFRLHIIIYHWNSSWKIHREIYDYYLRKFWMFLFSKLIRKIRQLTSLQSYLDWTPGPEWQTDNSIDWGKLCSYVTARNCDCLTMKTHAWIYTVPFTVY
jgi:hypothetical protein